MNSANEGKGPSPLDSKLDVLFDSLRGRVPLPLDIKFVT